MPNKLRDLEADLAICEAAAPGPWDYFPQEVSRSIFSSKPFSSRRRLSSKYIAQISHEPSRRFVCEAREGWPYAIRQLMAAENRIDRLEHELRMLQDHLNEVSRPYGHYTIDHSS